MAGTSRLLIERFEDGPIWTVGYLVYDPATKDAVIIDVPLWSAEKIYRRIRSLDMNVKYIVATHGHWDHIGEMKKLKSLTEAKVCAHPSDEWMMSDPNGMVIAPPEFVEPVNIDVHIEDGTTLEVGGIIFNVIHTPGHSAGSICLFARDDGTLFTGDTLFAGSIGRTDLPSGSMEEISRSIYEKIMSLPETTTIFPGHGPQSTLKHEKAQNQFVQMIFSER